MSKVDMEKLEKETKDTIDEARDRTSMIGSNIVDTVKEKANYLKGRAESVGGDISNYVNENPWKSVGIGVAAGIVIAKLLGLRK